MCASADIPSMQGSKRSRRFPSSQRSTSNWWPDVDDSCHTASQMGPPRRFPLLSLRPAKLCNQQQQIELEEEVCEQDYQKVAIEMAFLDSIKCTWCGKKVDNVPIDFTIHIFCKTYT